MARKITDEIREQVRRRANLLCEYCHTNERWQYVRFTVDHVVPGGESSPANLALACFHCNRRKSDKTEAIDPETNKLVEIFNARQHFWKTHFTWSADGLRIIPLTSIGRATVALLELNRERILSIREADVVVNRHPPIDDLN
ncbi:MAG: HNH endonuclease [Acidobacteriota bacterium]|nr:HNH endonuclease [Acidobacteriota bacterium]